MILLPMIIDKEDSSLQLHISHLCFIFNYILK